MADTGGTILNLVPNDLIKHGVVGGREEQAAAIRRADNLPDGINQGGCSLHLIGRNAAGPIQLQAAGRG